MPDNVSENVSVLSVADGIETPINDIEQLREQVKFLFRTDNRQQWTTDKTPDDWVSFPIFDEKALEFGDEDNRRGLADIFSDAVTVMLAGENNPLEDDMIKDYLFMFTLTKTNDKGEIQTVPFTLDERDFVIGQFIESPYADLIALICHRDEKDGCERMHGVFVWEPGKLNRVMSVLSPELYEPEEEPGEDEKYNTDEEKEADEDEGEEPSTLEI